LKALRLVIHHGCSMGRVRSGQVRSRNPETLAGWVTIGSGPKSWTACNSEVPILEGFCPFAGFHITIGNINLKAFSN